MAYFGAGRISVLPALYLSQDYAEIDDTHSSFMLMDQTLRPENRGSDPGMFIIGDVKKLEIYKEGRPYPRWPTQASQN